MSDNSSQNAGNLNSQGSAVELHRVIKASAEKLYKAFTDPVAIASWLPPYGFICSVQHMEAVPDGHYQMTFHNFTTGSQHSFSGRFSILDHARKIQMIESFDNPMLPGEMTTTVQLTAVSCGTDVHIIQSGIPALIPTEMCYLGWQDSLDKLIRLVEPVIPDA